MLNPIAEQKLPLERLRSMTFDSNAALLQHILGANTPLYDMDVNDTFLQIFQKIPLTEWFVSLSLSGADTAFERLVAILISNFSPAYLKIFADILLQDKYDSELFSPKIINFSRKIMRNCRVAHINTDKKMIYMLGFIYSLYELRSSYHYLAENKKEFILFIFHNSEINFYLESEDLHLIKHYLINKALGVVLKFYNETLIDIIFKLIPLDHPIYSQACFDIAKHYQRQEDFTNAQKFFNYIANDNTLYSEAQISIVEMSLALLPSKESDKKLRKQMLEEAIICCTKTIHHINLTKLQLAEPNKQKIIPVKQLLNKLFSLLCGYDGLVYSIEAPANLLDLSKSIDSYAYQLKHKRLKYQNPLLPKKVNVNRKAASDQVIAILPQTSIVNASSSLSMRIGINSYTFPYLDIFNTIKLDLETQRYQFTDKHLKALRKLLALDLNEATVQWEKVTNDEISLAHWLILILEYIYSLIPYDEKQLDINMISMVIQSFSAEVWNQRAMLSDYGNIAVINLFFTYRLQLLAAFDGKYLSNILEKQQLDWVSTIEKGKYYASFSLLTQVLVLAQGFHQLSKKVLQQLAAIPAQEWLRNLLPNVLHHQSAFEIIIEKILTPTRDESNSNNIVNLLFSLLLESPPDSAFFTLDSALRIHALVKGSHKKFAKDLTLIYFLYRIQIYYLSFVDKHKICIDAYLKQETLLRKINKISFAEHKKYLHSATFLWVLKIYQKMEIFEHVIKFANNLSCNDPAYLEAQHIILELSIKLALNNPDNSPEANILYHYQGLIAAAKLMLHLEKSSPNTVEEYPLTHAMIKEQAQVLFGLFCNNSATNWVFEKAEDLLDLSRPQESYINQLHDRRSKCKKKMLENPLLSLVTRAYQEYESRGENLLPSFANKRTIDVLHTDSAAHEKDEYDPNSAKKRKT